MRWPCIATSPEFLQIAIRRSGSSRALGACALLLLIALCLFGAKRLPEIGRSLGSGMREFKDSVTHQALPETTETEKTD